MESNSPSLRYSSNGKHINDTQPGLYSDGTCKTVEEAVAETAERNRLMAESLQVISPSDEDLGGASVDADSSPSVKVFLGRSLAGSNVLRRLRVTANRERYRVAKWKATQPLPFSCPSKTS